MFLYSKLANKAMILIKSIRTAEKSFILGCNLNEEEK